MRIASLGRYQHRQKREQSARLTPFQQNEADAIYQRLCARWNEDMPQWRKAILWGQARRLARNPPSSAWGRAMRARRGRPKREAGQARPALSRPPAPGGVRSRGRYRTVAPASVTLPHGTDSGRDQDAHLSAVYRGTPATELTLSPPLACADGPPPAGQSRPHVRPETRHGVAGGVTPLEVTLDLPDASRKFGEKRSDGLVLCRK